MDPSAAPAPVSSGGAAPGTEPDTDFAAQPIVGPAIDPDVSAAPIGVVSTTDTDPDFPADPDEPPDTSAPPDTDSPEISNAPSTPGSMPGSTPTASDDEFSPGGLRDKLHTVSAPGAHVDRHTCSWA